MILYNNYVIVLIYRVARYHTISTSRPRLYNSHKGEYMGINYPSLCYIQAQYQEPLDAILHIPQARSSRANIKVSNSLMETKNMNLIY